MNDEKAEELISAVRSVTSIIEEALTAQDVVEVLNAIRALPGLLEDLTNAVREGQE